MRSCAERTGDLGAVAWSEDGQHIHWPRDSGAETVTKKAEAALRDNRRVLRDGEEVAAIVTMLYCASPQVTRVPLPSQAARVESVRVKWSR